MKFHGYSDATAAAASDTAEASLTPLHGTQFAVGRELSDFVVDESNSSVVALGPDGDVGHLGPHGISFRHISAFRGCQCVCRSSDEDLSCFVGLRSGHVLQWDWRQPAHGGDAGPQTERVASAEYSIAQMHFVSRHHRLLALLVDGSMPIFDLRFRKHPLSVLRAGSNNRRLYHRMAVGSLFGGGGLEMAAVASFDAPSVSLHSLFQHASATIPIAASVDRAGTAPKLMDIAFSPATDLFSPAVFVLASDGVYSTHSGEAQDGRQLVQGGIAQRAVSS